MISVWVAAWLMLAGSAALISFLLLMQTWEHRRFARKRLSAPADNAYQPRVLLLAPCKGLDVGLADNLRPLLTQRYSNYGVAFIVESANDPAVATIEAVLAEHPHVAARMIVAGASARTGQKVHNLLAATANLTDDIEVLAFVDSDARPHADWLSCLVQRLNRPNIGVATGYRWFVPQRLCLANLLLYSINATTAALYNPSGYHAIWGGSWAIRREVFDRINVRRAWQGTLSDDLVATELMVQHKLRVEFEPACMLASPLDSNLPQMFAFLRRQYVLGRIHLSQLWTVSLLVATVSNLAFWGSLAWGMSALLTGKEHAWGPLVAALAIWALQAWRGLLRRDLAHQYLKQLTPATRAAIWFDVLAGPLVGLVNLLGMASSIVGNQLEWRGIRYHFRADGAVIRVQRISDDATTPAERIIRVATPTSKVA